MHGNCYNARTVGSSRPRISAREKHGALKHKKSDYILDVFPRSGSCRGPGALRFLTINRQKLQHLGIWLNLFMWKLEGILMFIFYKEHSILIFNTRLL